MSELFLAQHAGGATELRMKIKVDVLGRLGTFGLSAMKTKADRMWDEFGVNLAARLAPAQATAAVSRPSDGRRNMPLNARFGFANARRNEAAAARNPGT